MIQAPLGAFLFSVSKRRVTATYPAVVRVSKCTDCTNHPPDLGFASCVIYTNLFHVKQLGIDICF